MLPSVGVCAIFKNEAPYLREWLLFHWLQGVERFYLYDNGSSDAWPEAIPEVADLVTHWPGRVQQMRAYDDCLSRKPGVDWLAFIDIDEFLWDSSGRTLPEVLTGVMASAVHIPWLMFGDGGHIQPPRGLTIDCFLRRSAVPQVLGKQIVRPERAQQTRSPHEFYLSGPVATVETLRLNHYWTRSDQEVRMKFNRGRAAHHTRRQVSEFLASRDSLFEVVDGAASEMYGPILRREFA